MPPIVVGSRANCQRITAKPRPFAKLCRSKNAKNTKAKYWPRIEHGGNTDQKKNLVPVFLILRVQSVFHPWLLKIFAPSARGGNISFDFDSLIEPNQATAQPPVAIGHAIGPPDRSTSPARTVARRSTAKRFSRDSAKPPPPGRPSTQRPVPSFQ